jgi:cytochrome bd ubiquinol oxidase subunit II
MELGLPEVVAIVTMVALNAYVLTGGADFGGGVWDLCAGGPRAEAQRHLIAEAIGPIWEANHVWLIVVVVMLFGAFPPAFSTLGIVLHIPLTAMLVGIVLRGCGFVFRKYGTLTRIQRQAGRTFAIASAITPLLFGLSVGAVASGAVGRAAALLATAQSAHASPSFLEVFVAPWLALFPAAVGVLTLALFAFLAAIYLAAAAPTEDLRYDFRRRALIAAVVVFAAAIGSLLLAPSEAPHVATRLAATPSAMLFQLAIGVAGLATLVALWRGRWRVARVTGAAQVSMILWGWAMAQHPYVIPFTLTIGDAAAPRVTLELLLGGLVIGSVILLPSLAYLFAVFSKSQSAP